MTPDRYALEDIEYPDTPFPLLSNLVLLGKRGSEAHGTYIPPSDPDAIDDRDVMGIVVPPLEYHLGLKHWEGQDSFKGPWDVVLYSLEKFVRLLVQQNPNVICMLWLRPEDYLYMSPVGHRLLEYRDLFRARTAAYNAFVGYARGQFKRMTHFQPYRGYMGAKRKALVDKYGYDTKNAAHLIRLLKMGIEYLGTGQMQVYRKADRDLILAIKQGGWKLEDVKLLATELFNQCDYAYDHSTLPESIDTDEVNALLVRLTRIQLEI